MGGRSFGDLHVSDISPLQLDTGSVRYIPRAMQTFGNPDSKLYSFIIICNIWRGHGDGRKKISAATAD